MKGFIKFLTVVMIVFTTAFASAAQGNNGIPKLVVQEGHNGSVNYVKFSQDGKYILSASNNQIKVWDAQIGFLIKTITLPVS